MIEEYEKKNYEQLTQAFEDRRVVLVETKRKTGERAVLICAINEAEDPEMDVEFVPFAELMTVNPYEVYMPPEEAMKEDENDSQVGH